MVKISLPSGDTKEYSNKISVLEVAKSISPTLAKKAVFATVDQVDRPLNFVIEQDSNLILHTKEEQVSLNSLRATTAFFLGKAIKTFNSEAVLGDNNFLKTVFITTAILQLGKFLWINLVKLPI